MYRKTIMMAATVFSVLLIYANAFAAWSFNITTDYSAGDAQAVFNLNFSTDETAAISTYGFEFSFDNTELNYVSFTNSAPTGMTSQGLGPYSYDQDAGTINSFNASAFPFPVNVDPGDYLIGSFTFDVTDAVADGATDFDFDYDDPMLAFFVNGVGSSNSTLSNYALTNMTDIAPAAAAVPVPSAFWLFGSGIAGIACFRRRRA